MCNPRSLIALTLCSYTKPKGQLPDYEAPVVLKQEINSIEDFGNTLHRAIMREFK